MARDQETGEGRERRRHDRFACTGSAEVTVFDPMFLFRGQVRDISQTGCYIETRAQLSLRRFAEVELKFVANGKHLRFLARVMDIRPGIGAGFEFLTGDPRMDGTFLKFIEGLSNGAEQVRETDQQDDI